VSEEQEKTSFREEFEAHLDRPLTILMRLRNFIFGTESPDLYTKFSFFLALIGWVIFMTWSVVSTVVIRMREVIIDTKEIDVTTMIGNRGIALGFEPDDFLGRLEAFHALSIGFWVVVFVGLVMLWRKNERFIYVFWAGCGLYIVFLWVMLGFSYYVQDTTFFDKIAFLVLVGHTSAYAYFLKRERSGNRVRMFGIEEEEDDDVH